MNRKHRTIALLLTLVTGAATWMSVESIRLLNRCRPRPSQTASAVIRAPERASAGELVVLDATTSTADGLAWIVAEPEARVLAVDDGRRCVFASPHAGSYTFVLAAAKGGRVATATHRLTLTNAGPEPPEPSPERFGLASDARRWAGDVALEPSLRQRTASSLAHSFRATHAAIVAGALTEPATILAETKQRNLEALGPHADAWSPWGERLAERLGQLHQEGRLTGPDDYAEAWREIAIGLDRIQPGVVNRPR
ncbi:hypothetical protein Pan216_08550 [Planctomycetes bacterium Pan216]|uniref:Uncharacterized protein n=1 Tax=Kolteria novifilia TaxID=2527975 RepID=A0A518AZ57_9BACT|nr:hypothetical protein Pan216_08550 [Planctomycetes bacterium Pan216]